VQRTEGSCAPRPKQDERGPPKAITASKFFAAEIGWTPFQLSRKCWRSCFLLIALFFSFFVSTIPDSTEEQWLLARLPDTDFWITKPREEKNQAIRFDRFAATNSGRKSLDINELNDYEPNRISECHENSSSNKQAETAGAQTANSMPGAKPDSPQKCYWIDSLFPRNLILREKLLTV